MMQVNREASAEFSHEYEQQQHFRRLREMRSPVNPSAKQKIDRQVKLNIRVARRIEIIQMADLPRFHYEVWAEFDDGGSELLQDDYVCGLKNALRMAIEKWGLTRVELCRWHPEKHKPLLAIR